LIFHGYLNADGRLKKTGLLLFTGLIFILGLFFIYQFQVKGTAGYVSSGGRGFFPEHLQQLYPFATSAFITPELLTILFQTFFGPGQLFYQLLWLLNVLLAGVFLVFVFRFYRRKETLKRSQDKKASFYLLAFFVSASVVGVLVALSLFVSPEINFGNHLWTYVKEARYFGLVCILLQIAFFVFLQHDFKKSRPLLKASAVLLGALLLMEVGRGFLFNLNRIRLYGKEEYTWQYEDRFQKYSDTVVRKANALYPNTKVIIAGPSYYLNHRITLYSHVPTLYKPEIIKDSAKAKTTRPVVAITYEKEEQRSDDNKASQHKILAGKFEDFYFYIHHVSPR
jgi:hypothetical protein